MGFKHFRLGTIVTILLSLGIAQKGLCWNSVSRSLRVDDLKRDYLLHVPGSYPQQNSSALLFVFHGGGGDALQAEKHTKFSQLADEKGFIVVYPNAIDKQWNDGRGVRKFRSQKEKIDDVGFVLAIIDTLSAEYNINRSGIFIAGVSNGAIFCNRLAAEASETFAAMAAVIGSMAKPVARKFHPRKSIPVLIMNGTQDPLVPFKGGGVGFLGFRGQVIGVEACVRKWVRHNKCARRPVISELPDIDPDDGTRVTRRVYSSRVGSGEVVYYKIENGGHNWPGGQKYLSEKIVGKLCKDIDATKIIWEFFNAHITHPSLRRARQPFGAKHKR